MYDVGTRLSNEQAITASARSTNQYDTQIASHVSLAGGDIGGFGAGRDVYGLFQIRATFNTLTSLDLQLRSSADSAFTSPVVNASKNVTLASGGLAINQEHLVAFPKTGILRYVEGYYNVNGSNPSTGKVTLYITDEYTARQIPAFA